MQHTLSVPNDGTDDAEANAVKAWQSQVDDLGWQPGKRATTGDDGKAAETTDPEVVVNGGVIRVQGPVEPKSDDDS